MIEAFSLHLSGLLRVGFVFGLGAQVTSLFLFAPVILYLGVFVALAVFALLGQTVCCWKSPSPLGPQSFQRSFSVLTRLGFHFLFLLTQFHWRTLGLTESCGMERVMRFCRLLVSQIIYYE